MSDWQGISQQLQQFVNTSIRFVKARRREETAISFAAILFYLAYNIIKWLPEELQGFVKSWQGDRIIPGVLVVIGLGFLLYGAYCIWKLVSTPDLPPPTDRPSAIKGPLAFTPADGELFRKLGRDKELAKLLDYVENDQVRLIVLMGASGAGKTSLLRAGLTDIIKNKNIRFHYWEAVPTDSGRALLKAVQETWETKANGDEINLRTVPETLDDLLNISSQKSGNTRHIIVLDQFEQLRGDLNGQIFRLLQKLIRKTKPPYLITWIIAFRREFRADWSDFIIPEQEERQFSHPEISLQLFSTEKAKDVISQLIKAAELRVEDKVVDNLLEAATVEHEVSSVDIGIGLLILSELSARQNGKTVTEEDYHFAGGAEGLLTQYISRCLDNFPDEDRKTIEKAMLTLRDKDTNQRFAEGKTIDEIAVEVAQMTSEVTLSSHRLKTHFERLTQRDMRLLEHAPSNDDKEIRYRLPHERLIPALNRLAGTLIDELDRTKRQFTNAFSDWSKNKTSIYLLKGKDLRLVEQYKSQIPWGKEEKEKLAFLKKSQQHRTLKRMIAAVLVISLLIGGWFGKQQYRRYEVNKFLRENSYPSEFYDYQNQLTKLELSEALNLKELFFLHSEKLEELTIAATDQTNSTEGLADIVKKCPSIKKINLTLDPKRVNILENLTKLPGHIKLNVKMSGSFGNSLEPLTRLPNLDQLELNIFENPISGLESLAQLPSQTQLKIKLPMRESVDLNLLTKLPNLTELEMDNDEISNLEPIGKLSNLTKLKLSFGGGRDDDPKINSIEPLANLSNLTDLDLSLGTTEVKDLEPLSRLPKLNRLTLNPNYDTESIEPLTRIPNLTHLYMRYGFINRVKDFQLLGKLSKLTEFEIKGDFDKEDIEAICTLPNITGLTLMIGFEENLNFEPLTKLPNLTKLELNYSISRANTLEPLAKLPNISELKLELGGKITSLEPLVKLSKLKKLEIRTSYNKITSLEPLANLSDLSELELSLGGGVTNIQPLSNLQNLSKLKLYLDEDVTDAKSLSNLQNLSELTLRAKVSDLEQFLDFKCKSLELNLSKEQKLSLKTIPKSVINLKF